MAQLRAPLGLPVNQQVQRRQAPQRKDLDGAAHRYRITMAGMAASVVSSHRAGH